MTNQLIQDPNKTSSGTNTVTFKDIVEPISYFLAGSFLINTGLQQKSAEGAVLSDWLTSFVIGGFLILSGFIFIIANLPFKCLVNFRKNLRRIYDKYIYSIVFIITIAKLIFTTIDFAKYPTLFYIGFIFLIMVLLEMIITLENIRKLLIANLILYLLTFYLVLIGADKLKIITILGISFFSFVVAICRVWNRVGTKK